MSDIEFRVDKAFSTAVEEQLAEQRAIRALVTRVDESLIALSDGLGDVAGHIDAVGERVTGVGVSPEDLSSARQQLTEHIEGVSRQLSAVEERLSQRTDDDSLAITMSETRADLLDALARLERSSLPIVEAVEDSRQDVITTLQRISDVIDADRDQAWDQAIGRLDAAIAHLGVGQQEQQGAAETAFAAQQDTAEAALAAQQGTAEAALAAQKGAAEAALVGQQGTAEAALAAQQDAAEAALAAQQDAAEAALKVMEARARATFEEMVANLAAGREDIVTQVGRLASEVDVRNDDIADSLAAVLAASTQVAPQVQEVLSGIAGRLTDLMRDQKEEASEVVRLMIEVRASSQRGEERLDSLTTTVAGRLEGLAAERLAEIQEVTGESARRTDSAVQQAVADLLGAQAETSTQNRVANDTIIEAAGVIQPLLEQAIQDLSSAVLTSSERGVERMGALGVTIAARLEATTEERLLAMHEDASRTAAEVRSASESLVGTAETIQPALRAALDDLTAALKARTEGDRDDVDAAIARLADAAVEARETVVGEVGRATARLSEAQAAGIERLTAVSEDLGRLPDTIHPPVMEAMRQMQAAVGEAITDLRTTTSDAAHQAKTTLEDAARMSESATEALGQLATGLEPAVRAALAEVQTTLLATSAADRNRAEHNISAISEASQAAADGIRGATDAATENLSRSAETATTRLVMAQADGVEALSEAAVRLNEASGEIPGVMGEARTGLLEAVGSVRTGLLESLTQAQGDIDTLLTRADEVTDRRVGAMFSRASTMMAEQLADHEEIMVARTRDLVEATDRVTPTVDELVTRLQGEVATIATTVIADLEAPIGEAGRVAEAMAPALERVLTDFREELSAEIVANQSRAAEISHKMTSAAVSLEQTGAQFVPTAESLVNSLISAVDGVAERTAGAASLGVGESREVLLRAIEDVRTELTAQMESAELAARRSALVIETAQTDGVESMQAATAATVSALETTNVRGTEQLQAAAAAIGEIAGRLEPGVAAIVEDLRASLLEEAVAERTRADASIILLREDVAATVEMLRAEVTATRETTVAATTDLTERADGVRAAMDEGVDVFRRELATSTAGQETILQTVASAADALAGAAQEAAAATREAVAVNGEVANGTETTRGQITSLVDDLREQVGHALDQVGNLTQVLHRSAASNATDSSQIAGQVDRLDTLVTTVAEAVTEIRSTMATAEERPGSPTLFDDSEDSLATRLDSLEERVVQAVRALSTPARATTQGVDTAAVQRTVDAAVQQTAHVGQTRLDAVLARMDIAVDRIAVDGDRKTTAAKRTEQIVSDLQRSVADGQAQTRSALGTLAEQIAKVLAAQGEMRGELRTAPPSEGRASPEAAPVAEEASLDDAEERPRVEAPTTCPDCGFVARTAAGLMAHSRTCSGHR